MLISPHRLLSLRKELSGLTRKEGMERFATEFPVGEFVGISAEDAVSKLAEALKSWDEQKLKAILRGYPLKRLEAAGYKGCEVTITGAAFRSGVYGGLFVPCGIKFADGSKRKINLALRNDNQWNCWEVDGGI